LALPLLVQEKKFINADKTLMGENILGRGSGFKHCSGPASSFVVQVKHTYSILELLRKNWVFFSDLF